MRLFALAVVATLSSGCHASFEEAHLARVSEVAATAPKPRDDARCASLDNQKAVFKSTAVGTGVVAGGGAVSTLLEEVRDSKVGRIGVAISAGVLAGVSAFSAHMADMKGESWARECSE